MGFTTGAGPCTLRAMQDRFVGDIGDFGKYGLLRALTGIWPPLPPEDRLSLGVVWYRNEDTKGGPSKRKNTEYLFDPHSPIFREYDHQLHDILKEIVSSSPSLEAVESSFILGEDSCFYEEIVPQNTVARKDWAKKSQEITREMKVIFLDPDTGIAPSSVKMGTKKSLKYIFPEEILPFLSPERNQTIIIYQHYARDQKGRENQMFLWKTAIEGFYRIPRILATSQRAFIILPTPDHAANIDKRLHNLTNRWGRRFFHLAL